MSTHSRPAHPQTNGKAEVLNGRSFENLDRAQYAFDHWRTVYNCERPHEALGLDTPVCRYRASPRPYPEQLPPIGYGTDDRVLYPDANGWVRLAGRPIKVPKARHRLPVALRPRATQDGLFDVYFCHYCLMRIDLRE